MKNVALRPYQSQAVERLREQFRSGKRRLLLTVPTGGGKTIIATEIVKGAVEKGNSALFVCHRRELIYQASDKLSRLGIDHGLILAGEEPNPYARVQVASIQTLHARKKWLELPEAQVVILDEAHHALSRTWRELVEAYPSAAVIGLTATPVRGDGKGLGHIFESLIHGPSISTLTQDGYLVPVRYFAPSIPELWGVKVRMGDYVQGELGRVMDKPKLIGDIVANWGRIAPERKTVIFASSVAHSLHIKEQFEAAGVRVEHLDGDTPKDERDGILADLDKGRIQVVTNCMVLTEGWDCPSVSCAVLARPTKALGLYLQMAGRVLRPAEGKTDTILIDHSGAVYEHGFLDQTFPWSLDLAGKVQDRMAERKAKEPKPITCDKCHTIYSGQLPCPACGHVPERRGNYVATAEGSLGEVSSAGREKRKVYTMEEKTAWYQMLKHIQLERGYKDGWTGNQYRDKFGVWPQGMKGLGPLYPSLEVERYVKHKQIKFAKSREARRAA